MRTSKKAQVGGGDTGKAGQKRGLRFRDRQDGFVDERVESELSLEGTNESKGKSGAGGGKSNLEVSGLSVKCESRKGRGSR